MARTEQQWAALVQSPLLTKEIYEVLTALWPYPQGLTKAEVDKTLQTWGNSKNAALPWEKQLSVMAQMGIVKRIGKRHCSVKNKPDVVWDLTDALELKKPKVAKPSAKKFALAVGQLDQLVAYHERANDGFITVDIKKLLDWVRDKVQVPAAK